jgi:hypothetical protein
MDRFAWATAANYPTGEVRKIAMRSYELVATWKDNLGSGAMYKFCDTEEAAKQAFAYYLINEKFSWTSVTIQLVAENGEVINTVARWTPSGGWQSA